MLSLSKEEDQDRLRSVRFKDRTPHRHRLVSFKLRASHERKYSKSRLGLEACLR